METARLLHSLIPTSHYLPSQRYNTTLTPTQGFHRTLTFSIPSFSTSAPTTPYPPTTPTSLPEETTTCILQALLFLPPDIFSDPYELSQRQSDGRLGEFKVWGEVDLEGPVMAVDPAGTALLLSVDTTTPPDESERQGLGVGMGGGVDVDVPLHLRYPKPMDHQQAVEMGWKGRFEVPWPVVYWACEGAREEEEFSPFDALPEPFRSPYARNTTFRFLRPTWEGDDAKLETEGVGWPAISVQVPTGDLSHLPIVEWGTSLTVLFAFLYVAWYAWSVPSSSLKGASKAAADDAPRKGTRTKRE